jgi:hypothetical protein
MTRPAEYKSFAVTTSDQVLLPQSAHRKAITISVANSSGFVNIAFGKVATVQDYGIHIYGGQHTFTKEQLGGLIDADVHVIGSASTYIGVIVLYEG